jgi:hypothetical protein
MGRRFAAKVDSNQNPIVKGLREIFGPDCVFDLSAVGRGCPDLMVGVRGRTLLMEIKTDKGELTTDQKIFHRIWDGHVAVVRSLEEALEVIERETT